MSCHFTRLCPDEPRRKCRIDKVMLGTASQTIEVPKRRLPGGQWVQDPNTGEKLAVPGVVTRLGLMSSPAVAALTRVV